VKEHPELQAKVLTPDVLLQHHFASLEMLFYTGSEFPQRYRDRGFAAQHGSWNRAARAGYEVISFPTVNGHATGESEDFLTGFVPTTSKLSRIGEPLICRSWASRRQRASDVGMDTMLG
jgi:glucose/arabinose dehydrogenase